MPRNGAGVYSLPAGNPVVTLTTISSTWANTTMSDIATALTQSLATTGVTPMTGPLQMVDGSNAAPGLTWASETTSGWYKETTHVFDFSVNTVKILSVSNAGLTVFPQTASGGVLIVGSAGNVGSLAIKDGQAGTRQWSLVAGLTSIGSFDLVDNTAVKTRISVATTGGVTVLQPDSGVPLTLNGIVASTVILSLVGGAAQGSALVFADNISTLQQWIVGSGIALGAGIFEIRDSTRGATPLSIGKTGSTVFAVPAAGKNIFINGLSGSDSLGLTGSANHTIAIDRIGSIVGRLGLFIGDATNGTVQDDAYIMGNQTSLHLGVWNGATGNASYISIGFNGGVSIATPTSGVAFNLIGSVPGSFGSIFNATTSAGNSFGVAIIAGTTSADLALQVNNAANSTNYLRVFGDGGLLMAAATGGTQGLGSINATSLFINGAPVRVGIPVNNQAGSYTLVLADANCAINSTNAGAATITIPSNAAVAFPIGTAVTFTNRGSTAISIAITTDTLVIAGTTTTGTRTLNANSGSATAFKVSATLWIIQGGGLT